LSSTLTKIIISVFVIIGLSACSSKNLKSSYYNSNSYKNSKTYQNIRNQKIRNSTAMHRATMRSYTIRGIKYYPKLADLGAKYHGIASWYGPNFHAKKTSNGEIYNMHAETAASKTLPMNTVVKVYNKDNGKSTIVRINDRGPFISGRIIDLSNKSAHKVDMVRNGTANVVIEVIGFNGKIGRGLVNQSEPTNKEKYYVQVGVFSNLNGALKTKNKYNILLKNSQYNAMIKQEHTMNGVINRVWIQKFQNQEDVNNFTAEYDLTQTMTIVK
jgi:rare lipoprotein A